VSRSDSRADTEARIDNAWARDRATVGAEAWGALLSAVPISILWFAGPVLVRTGIHWRVWALFAVPMVLLFVVQYLRPRPTLRAECITMAAHTFFALTTLFGFFYFGYLQDRTETRKAKGSLTEVVAALGLRQGLGGLVQPGPDIKGDSYEQGPWLIVNESGLQLSPEWRNIPDARRPRHASEVKYVVVVGNARRESAGYWKYPGPSGGEEHWRTVYTVYVIDWKDKKLVCRKSLSSRHLPRSWLGFGKPPKENQRSSRETIEVWLRNKGFIP